MPYTDWMIKTRRLATCSCDYGCPCEFNGRPTRGFCEGIEAGEIVTGHFDAVRLDGLRFAGVYRWPGAVHEGGGSYLLCVDERATQEQVDALFQIFSGKEQEPTTGFNIYASTIEHEYDPVFAPIEFEWDLPSRQARVRVPDVFDAALAPIRNPVTGAPHRALIKLPDGFEFREAEMASSTFTVAEPLPQRYQDCYGYLSVVAYGPYGIIEEQSLPAVTA